MSSTAAAKHARIEMHLCSLAAGVTALGSPRRATTAGHDAKHPAISKSVAPERARSREHRRLLRAGGVAVAWRPRPGGLRAGAVQVGDQRACARVQRGCQVPQERAPCTVMGLRLGLF